MHLQQSRYQASHTAEVTIRVCIYRYSNFPSFCVLQVMKCNVCWLNGCTVRECDMMVTDLEAYGTAHAAQLCRYWGRINRLSIDRAPYWLMRAAVEGNRGGDGW